MTAITDPVADYIRTELAPQSQGLELTPDYPLIQAGLVDSLGLFRLVTFLQDRFGIKIRAQEIVFDHFATLAAIEALVVAKQQSSEEAP